MAGAGCAPIAKDNNLTSVSMKDTYATLNLETPVQFEETVESQDAVFYMGQGWTGGMGSFPILEDPGDAKRMDDLVIFVDDEQAQDIIDNANLPECYVGMSFIKVAAKIHLEKKIGTNFSIEEAPEQSYYQAYIDELYNVFVQVEPCEE
ncbi:MAG TPA: hypothetical protein DCS29_02575 [Candidatus Magasanikbacteria bacterium]|nr:MAG: hypothetical protein A2479_00075 [Candidatus Magasanikbacteria bacterium RIFOXYC2_FULL_39_8]HAT03642.1 hypothetical protein [Candidatus Magasanikbacteria bacterium]